MMSKALSINVYRADTGQLCEVELLPAATVLQLKTSLARITGISIQDQILLCNELKLDNESQLPQVQSTNGMDDGNVNGVTIFLFNRKALEPATTPLLPPAESVKVTLPPETPFISSATGNQSSLLSKYQHFLLCHSNYATVIRKATEKRQSLSQRSLSEQENQAKALEAAIANLNDHHRQILQAFDTFKSHLASSQMRHQSLLDTFEKDLTRLRDISLHPALQTQTLRTLADCIPSEERLRRWAHECANQHEQLKSRVLELDVQVGKLIGEVDEENQRRPDVDLEDLGRKILKLPALLQDAILIKKLFKQDYLRVTKATLREAAAFEEVRLAHQAQIKRLGEIDSISDDVWKSFVDSKTRLTICVHERLRRVSSLQSSIRNFANRIIVCREALARQKQAFTQLTYVRYLPEAYNAALEEVARRKGFGRSVSDALARVGDILEAAREVEANRRKTFLAKYGKFIPQTLIPGLTDPLPSFRPAKTPPMDKGLPDIEGHYIVQDLFADLWVKQNQAEIKEEEPEKGPREESKKVEQRSEEDTAEIERVKREQKEREEMYKARLESLEVKLASTYKLITRMTERAEAAEKKVEQLEREKGNVSSPRADSREGFLFDKLSQVREENKLLVQSLKKANASILEEEEQAQREKELKQALQRLEQEKAALVADLAREKTEKEQALAQAKASRALVAGILAQYRETTSEVERKKRSPTSSTSATLLSSSSQIHYQQLLEVAEQKLGRLEQEKAGVIAALGEAETKIEKLQQNLASRDQEVAEHRSVQDLEKRLITKETECGTLQKKYNDAVLNGADQERALHNMIEELQDTKMKLTEVLESYKSMEGQKRAIEQEMLEKTKLVDELKGRASRLEITLKSSQAEFDELRSKMDAMRLEHRISVARFELYDVALFMMNAGGFYEAFNIGAPNYYLAGDSLALFNEERKKKGCIVGQIIEKQEFKASSGHNPYKLKDGTVFYEVNIVSMGEKKA